MTHEELLAEVVAHAGLRTPEEAELAMCATLETLAERLSRWEAEALADELPAAADPLRRRHYEGDFDLDELCCRVARREGVTLGYAIEHALSVCQVVGEAISTEGRARLQRALPESIARLFAPRPPAVEPPPRRHAHSNTLAEGRPGSRHPLSEAAADSAHRESISRAENPHAETKLSSSRGLMQEREHESLATGRPGSTHPLDEKD